MTAGMWRDLPGLLDGLAADPAVRVLVLRGAGGHFCAGADITDLNQLRDNGAGSLTTIAEGHLAAFPKPTIAQISGYCVGGGCQLAVACDLRFAASDALIGVPPAKLGIVYPAATTRRLVDLVGPSAAKYLLFSADPVDAEPGRRDPVWSTRSCRRTASPSGWPPSPRRSPRGRSSPSPRPRTSWRWPRGATSTRTASPTGTGRPSTAPTPPRAWPRSATGARRSSPGRHDGETPLLTIRGLRWTIGGV